MQLEVKVVADRGLFKATFVDRNINGETEPLTALDGTSVTVSAGLAWLVGASCLYMLGKEQEGGPWLFLAARAADLQGEKECLSKQSVHAWKADDGQASVAVPACLQGQLCCSSKKIMLAEGTVGAMVHSFANSAATRSLRSIQPLPQAFPTCSIEGCSAEPSRVIGATIQLTAEDPANTDPLVDELSRLDPEDRDAKE
eukprot:scaffold68215_cov20-Tisochrysis_lutea.AAC.1